MPVFFQRSDILKLLMYQPFLAPTNSPKNLPCSIQNLSTLNNHQLKKCYLPPRHFGLLREDSHVVDPRFHFAIWQDVGRDKVRNLETLRKRQKRREEKEEKGHQEVAITPDGA